MKLLKRVLATVLTLSMVMTLPSVTQANAEDKVDTPILISTNPNATKVELNLAQVQMGVGTKTKLCLSDISGVKAKWKSSNTKVAYVSKWGWVKAVKPGKAIVSAVYQGKTYNCTVTVSLKSQVTPTVVLCDYKNIHVSEQDAEYGLADAVFDTIEKGSTFYNLTEEYYDKAIKDYFDAFESLIPLLMGCSTEKFYASLGDGARETMRALLESQKELLSKQLLTFTEVAKKEGLVVTQETLKETLKSMVNDPSLQIDYDTYVRELVKDPNAAQCVCNYLTASKGVEFIEEHIIIDGSEE